MTAESLSAGFNYQRKYKSVQLSEVEIVSRSLKPVSVRGEMGAAVGLKAK